MYQRILVPTDGSEPMAEVVEHALDLAETYGAEVHALYVVNTGAVPSTDVELREQYVETGERIGRDAVADVERAAEEAGVDATTAVVHGTPADEIVDYAADRGVDLVVMGTHGRTGLGHFLLGSVAERVARQATVPVMLIRTAERD